MIIVTEAKNSDFPKIVDLVNRADQKFISVYTEDEVVEAGISSESVNHLEENQSLRTYLVIKDDDEIVGFAAFRLKNPKTVWVSSLYVAVEKQGRGLGPQLLKEVENWAKKFGAEIVVLETEKKADWSVNFYLKNGYKILTKDDLAKYPFDNILEKEPVGRKYIMGKRVIYAEAIEFAKRNKIKIARMLTDSNKIKPDPYPISVFMAGSPGAGKTEFSKSLIALLEDGKERRVLRIDIDEMRTLLPGYSGDNSCLFQYPASLILEKTHDYALKRKISFIMDGTFSKLNKSRENVRRSLVEKRLVHIFYIYQDPGTAWKFTENREKLDHRNIPKSVFVEEFINARESIETLRTEFDKEVKIFLVEKDFKRGIVKFVEIKPDNVGLDGTLPRKYTKEELNSLI